VPDFYYQIKKRSGQKSDGFFSSAWDWPPVFQEMVSADDKKSAKKLIDEEYQRTFPQRVLEKDLASHDFLLTITEIKDPNSYQYQRFKVVACPECNNTFRQIDKFNDPNSTHDGPKYCSAVCAEQGRVNEISLVSSFNPSKLPPVIYQIRQKSSGKIYVGQTTRPFTLRWWQHLSNPTSCKFHEAMKSSDLTDWEYSVLEVLAIPKGSKAAEYITARERHWIDTLDTVANGFNTIRPGSDIPEPRLELLLAEDSLEVETVV